MAIRLIDPKAQFEIVSEHDPSVIGETADELAELRKSDGSARYQKYMESLNVSDLKLADNEPPSMFVVRCLKNAELAALQEKYLSFDPKSAGLVLNNRTQYFVDIFNMCCLGVRQVDGSILKISDEDVGLKHASTIGAVIAYATTAGKNLKNV